ncbi:MAG TPA: YihY/virulence factor BrkB family protein [Candidatus Sulfotelmatobacter sp.]|nr:YihY/virulence factor BrkB family protein [Candidatus Sulfotelmatobacter sp.]HWI59841.1 YihY/virulence factor BrkB family protein [Bacillota bacterium]
MNWKAIWGLLKSAAAAWMDDNAPRLGAALSYYTVFALSPLFIIVIFIASLLFEKASVQAALFVELGNLVGQTGAQALQSALASSIPHSQGVLATAIAVGTLILTATGLFTELQGALNKIWGVEPKPGLDLWGFVKGRLLSFAMVVGIGFLLLVSLVVSTVLAALGKYLAGLVPGLHLFWMAVNATVSFSVITVLFAMIFKVLPDVKIAWRDVWVGSLITALLFTGGKFLLGLYLGRNSTVSAYGAAGSLVLILLWVYYSSQILFFGAELTQAYANRYGRRLEPENNARWIRPPEAMPAPKARPPTLPDRHQPDRKAQLLAELRDQVESLRAAREQIRNPKSAPRNKSES